MINKSEEDKDYKVELLNKDIVKRLNQLYNIRENYEELLQYAINNINSNIREVDYRYYKKYIESLFGYKTNEELLEVIKNYYGSGCDIKFNATTVFITCNQENIGKHLSIENNEAFIQMLKDIKNYSKNMSKISELKATINISAKTGLNKIEYTYNFDKQLYESLQYYSDGKIYPRNRQLRI